MFDYPVYRNFMNFMIKTPNLPRMLVALLMGLGSSFSALAAESVVTAAPVKEFTRETMFGLLVGEIAAQYGDLQLASSAYAEMANKTRDPLVAQRAFELLMAARQYPKAADAARLWAQVDPASVPAQEMNVALLLASGKTQEAQAAFAAHLVAHPERAAPLFLQLESWLDQLPNKTAPHLPIAEQFSLSAKTLPEANYAIAAAALNDGKPSSGLPAIEVALKKRSNWPEAALIKGGLLQIQSPAQALLWLEQWQKKQGVHPLTNSYLARLYLAENKIADAKKAFAQQIKIAPRDSYSPYVSGLLARDEDNHVAAVMYLEMALTRGYQEPDAARYYLADSQAEQKKLALALQNWDAINSDKWTLRALARSSNLRAKNGEADRALKQIQEARLRKDSPELWRMQADVLRESARLPDAYVALGEGLKQFAGDEELLYGRAMLGDQLGKYAEAEEDLKLVLSKSPEDAAALNALGYMLAERTDRLTEAAALIEKAHKLKPEDPFILDSLGWVYVRQGKLIEGLVPLQKAYAARPDPEIAAHLVENLWRLGRKDEAQNLWASANQKNPGHEALNKVQRALLGAP